MFLTSSTRDVQAVHAVDDDSFQARPDRGPRRSPPIFAERAAAEVDP